MVLNALDRGYIALMNRMSLLAFAGGGGDRDWAIQDIKSSGNGTFEQVDDAAKALGGDVYKTLMIIGGFGSVILLVIAFIYYAVAGSGNNKDQAKSKIMTVLIAVIGIFAAVFIVGLAMKIGDGLDAQEIK